MASIEDLLNQLKSSGGPVTPKSKGLPNNKDTWRRIANKDSFSELELSVSELDSFLSEWIKENPYNNIA